MCTGCGNLCGKRTMGNGTKRNIQSGISGIIPILCITIAFHLGAKSINLPNLVNQTSMNTESVYCVMCMLGILLGAPPPAERSRRDCMRACTLIAAQHELSLRQRPGVFARRALCAHATAPVAGLPSFTPNKTCVLACLFPNHDHAQCACACAVRCGAFVRACVCYMHVHGNGGAYDEPRFRERVSLTTS